MSQITITRDGVNLEKAEESTLRKRIIIDDDDNELTTVVEYRDYGNDRIIHRSVHMSLKKLPTAEASAAEL